MPRGNQKAEMYVGTNTLQYRDDPLDS
jgi:hypothetical protein